MYVNIQQHTGYVHRVKSDRPKKQPTI